MKKSPNLKRTPRIIIIAGPNGAGKTTFANEYLTREAASNDFINADLIARGLSPFAPEKAAVHAGKIMLSMIADRIARRASFSFETTLSGLSYARHIVRWRNAGYRVKLIFLSLPKVETAIERVAARVQHGGHAIPEDVIRRRFDAGLKNFRGIYCKLATVWSLYDNSVEPPRLIAIGKNR